MTLLKQNNKRQKEDEKKQQELAEKLVKIADEVIDFIVEKGFTEVWEFKTIHQLLSNKMSGAIDKAKIKDLLK